MVRVGKEVEQDVVTSSSKVANTVMNWWHGIIRHEGKQSDGGCKRELGSSASRLAWFEVEVTG
jgi:hypothetical protein